MGGGGEGGSPPDRRGAGYFLDAGHLFAPRGGRADADLVAVVRSLARADIGGDDPGAVTRAFSVTTGADRDRIRFAWNRAMRDQKLASFIEAAASRRDRAAAIAIAIAPPDPSPDHGAAAMDRIRAFDAWHRYEHALILVPGYTPLNATAASPGVHAVARRRLDLGARYLAEGRAPFLMVSGANVRPPGTPYFEAIEMKADLVRRGVDPARILVEARARHSTTNLRNAGRFMLDHGLGSALIATWGGGLFGSDLFGQPFYFAHPGLSRFHARCERDLGYRVGDLDARRGGVIAFTPSASVRRIDYKDALDP